MPLGYGSYLGGVMGKWDHRRVFLPGTSPAMTVARGGHIRNLPSVGGGMGLGSWAHLLDLLIDFENVTQPGTLPPGGWLGACVMAAEMIPKGGCA